jgi:hypothetical protein
LKFFLQQDGDPNAIRSLYTDFATLRQLTSECGKLRGQLLADKLRFSGLPQIRAVQLSESVRIFDRLPQCGFSTLADELRLAETIDRLPHGGAFCIS